ncbi:hypothetical protein [Catellatospora sichuanensis]|nr:hypothetical protein [Catellatospora sichuanensis]
MFTVGVTVAEITGPRPVMRRVRSGQVRPTRPLPQDLLVGNNSARPDR